MLLIQTFEANFSETSKEIHTEYLISENPFENVVWKMAAILSQPQCVKNKEWNAHQHSSCSSSNIHIDYLDEEEKFIPPLKLLY